MAGSRSTSGTTHSTFCLCGCSILVASKTASTRRLDFSLYISQPNRLWLYLLTCVGITGIVYWVIGTLNALLFAGLSAAVVLYQIVNFHHYIVDAMIWKGPKPATRESLPLIA